MRILTARKAGNSISLTIPQVARRKLGIKAGDYLVTDTVGELFVMCKYDRQHDVMTEPNVKRALELMMAGGKK